MEGDCRTSEECKDQAKRLCVADAERPNLSTHTYPNWSLRQGALLEPQLGTVRYAALLLELLLLSHGTVVLVTWTIAAVAPSWSGVYYRCVSADTACWVR